MTNEKFNFRHSLFITGFLCYSVILHAQTVPPVYQEVYNELEPKLRQITTAIGQRWDGQIHPTRFCSDLQMCNTRIQKTKLLTPGIYALTVQMLDALVEMGMTAVRFNFSYPFLVSTFPNSDQYLDLFQRIVQAARDRHFTVLINFAHYSKAEIVTLYWSVLFFGNLDYQPGYENLSSDSLSSLTVPQSLQNMNNGILTPVGRFYKEIISEANSETPVEPLPNSEPAPKGFDLQDNYPDPFNIQTTIPFTLPTRSQRLAGNALREALPQGSKWAGVFEVYPLRLTQKDDQDEVL